jgi:GT2 family glycosyltransferase
MRERKSPILLKTIWEKRREENVTAMMAIRREIIDIVSKFDPFFNIRGEDRDFLLRVKMHNIPLVFNKIAIVFHKKKSFKPRDYWRMRIPRARASIKFGLYVWRDTVAVVFYFSITYAIVGYLVNREIASRALLVHAVTPFTNQEFS